MIKLTKEEYRLTLLTAEDIELVNKLFCCCALACTNGLKFNNELTEKFRRFYDYPLNTDVNGRPRGWLPEFNIYSDEARHNRVMLLLLFAEACK